jgi:signal transduction protein with GAF and PtsI domain
LIGIHNHFCIIKCQGRVFVNPPRRLRQRYKEIQKEDEQIAKDLKQYETIISASSSVFTGSSVTPTTVGIPNARATITICELDSSHRDLSPDSILIGEEISTAALVELPVDNIAAIVYWQLYKCRSTNLFTN